jgi:hypothetical protein
VSPQGEISGFRVNSLLCFSHLARHSTLDKRCASS